MSFPLFDRSNRIANRPIGVIKVPLSVRKRSWAQTGNRRHRPVQLTRIVISHHSKASAANVMSKQGYSFHLSFFVVLAEDFPPHRPYHISPYASVIATTARRAVSATPRIKLPCDEQPQDASPEHRSIAPQSGLEFLSSVVAKCRHLVGLCRSIVAFGSQNDLCSAPFGTGPLFGAGLRPRRNARPPGLLVMSPSLISAPHPERSSHQPPHECPHQPPHERSHQPPYPEHQRCGPSQPRATLWEPVAKRTTMP